MGVSAYRRGAKLTTRFVLVLGSLCSRPSASYFRQNPLLDFHPDQCQLTDKAYAAQPDTERKGCGTKSAAPEGFAQIRTTVILPERLAGNCAFVFAAGALAFHFVRHSTGW